MSVCTGSIVTIDLPNRTLLLRAQNGEVLEMTAAPGCRVNLNGEEVRLRLLLIGDEVEASYIVDECICKAIRIDVLSGRRHQIEEAQDSPKTVVA
jgi:hypothetical protein